MSAAARGPLGGKTWTRLSRIALELTDLDFFDLTRDPESISVTPDSASVPIGLTQNYTATGTFAGQVRDITSLVTWSSETTTVATINPQGQAQGEPRLHYHQSHPGRGEWNGPTGGQQRHSYFVGGCASQSDVG